MRRGFTLVEMAVVIGVALVLIMLATINLTGSHSRSEFNSTATVLLSDIASQQLLAMQTQSARGIHFASSNYTLFTGSAYAAGNSSNVVIALPGQLNLSSITLPNSTIVFSRGSGEFTNYSATTNGFTLQLPSESKSYTFLFNRYGQIIQAN